MSEKKTKGGRKKMVFTPKAPPTDNFVISSEPLPQKRVIHQKLKHRKAPNSTVAFTAFANTKESKEMIVMKDEKGDLINFENEFDPQYINAKENENLFDDDIMYIFSGIERGRCKIMVDNDKVYYEENGVISEMVSKNIDHMKVVVINDDVKEIGSVYNAYTVCRNEL